MISLELRNKTKISILIDFMQHCSEDLSCCMREMITGYKD